MVMVMVDQDYHDHIFYEIVQKDVTFDDFFHCSSLVYMYSHAATSVLQDSGQK